MVLPRWVWDCVRSMVVKESALKNWLWYQVKFSAAIDVKVTDEAKLDYRVVMINDPLRRTFLDKRARMIRSGRDPACCKITNQVPILRCLPWPK